MSSFRLTVAAFLFALSLAGCNCTKAPVSQTLKPEGEACAADEECESSLCDKLPGKSSVCFRKCAQGCKTTEICTSLAQGDRYACVPDKSGLCLSCELNIDCPYPGDRCIQLGGVNVCARDCSFDGQCPSSYRCADATDSMGAFVSKQCQPTSGTCDCVASSAGQTRPCSETNSIGTCMGVQTCKPPTGYDACSALVPTTESCNGKDDDCNGMTDENLGETSCGVGECRRTISNCVNGAPQQCIAGSGSQEVCDEKDNDCDGMTDEGFDKTSVDHCGACNNACVRANAMPVCDVSSGTATCRIGACLPGFVNADMLDANGCELMCTPTGVEVCDGLDNNCDGRVDEGFQLSSDTNNCGMCGRVCNVNNGHVNQYACSSSQCGIMTCSMGFKDCDQSYGTGCEKNVSGDVNNCGDCNVVCTATNGTPACNNGMCGIGSCNAPFDNCDGMATNGCETNLNTNVDHCNACNTACPMRTNATRTCTMGSCGFTCNPGSIDLDGNPANGCEYACTVMGSDDPDDLSVDQNCDGIDGDATRALFVSKNGLDSNPGTRAQPKLTIQAAINAASIVTPHVYVSEGVYDETLTLLNGVSVFGGYSQTNNWARNSTYVVTVRSVGASNGRVIAAGGLNLTSPTTLAYFTLTGRDTVAPDTSVIGLFCKNCTGLTLRSMRISAGSAGAGSNGSPGTPGDPGNPGSPGTGGTCNDNSPGAPGGAGGTSSCGRVGGAGGRGGDYGSNAGVGGQGGVSGSTGGNPGGGGDPGGAGSVGSPGPLVGSGSAGSGGAGFLVVGDFIVANGGNVGSAGPHGNGGGGGGGGGGQGCFFCNDGNGNGAGGGGAGGCGGGAGAGGRGGGYSVGLYLVGSTGVVVSNCTISSANGGTGGAGGAGGSGGAAGGGGAGATVCTGEVGAGGNGGSGSVGGTGGAGGGGSGGPSYALYKVSTMVTPAGGSLTPGNGGNGGSGGSVGAAGTSAASN